MTDNNLLYYNYVLLIIICRVNGNAAFVERLIGPYNYKVDLVYTTTKHMNQIHCVLLSVQIIIYLKLRKIR